MKIQLERSGKRIALALGLTLLVFGAQMCAGILEGDFTLMQEGCLKLGYLPDGAQLVAGDEVLTSGKGGIYPSGLVVGQVEGVFTEPSGMTRYAVIRPRVDLDSLVEVFVIKDFDIIE